MYKQNCKCSRCQFVYNFIITYVHIKKSIKYYICKEDIQRGTLIVYKRKKNSKEIVISIQTYSPDEILYNIYPPPHKISGLSDRTLTI